MVEPRVEPDLVEQHHSGGGRLVVELAHLLGHIGGGDHVHAAPNGQACHLRVEGEWHQADHEIATRDPAVELLGVGDVDLDGAAVRVIVDQRASVVDVEAPHRELDFRSLEEVAHDRAGHEARAEDQDARPLSVRHESAPWSRCSSR